MGWALPAVLGGAALVGGILGNSAQKSMQEDQQSFNSEEAEKNRRWQEQMSSTAYQRQKKDLESAGYNPMLALQGGGATSGSGSAASSGIAQQQNVIGPAVASAIEARRAVKDVEVAESQIGVNDASKVKILADADLTDERIGETSASANLLRQKEITERFHTQKTSSEWSKTQSEESFTRLKTDALKSEMLAIKAKADRDAEAAKLEKNDLKFNQWNKRIQEGSNSAKAVRDIINPLSGSRLTPREQELRDLINAGEKGVPARRR